MHPMFVKLYLEPDDLLAEEERKRRTARQARRQQFRLAVRAAARDRDRRSSH